MKNLKYISFTCLLIALIICGCSSNRNNLPAQLSSRISTVPTAASIVPSQTPFPTQALVTTSTVQQPTATASLVPSPTPFPTPFEKGSHLIARLHTPKEEGASYIRGDDIVIFDVEGRGQRIIDLPQDSSVQSVPDAVSPDGKWVAYFSGKVENGDLTLSIASLHDQNLRKVAQVIAPNYQERLYKIAEKIAKEKQKTSQLTADDWMVEVLNSFSPGLYSLSWSPDSQTLAFAAQIDGSSSDLYLYDLKTSSTRRMIDDMENVGHVQWSPDGKRILLENGIPGEGGYTGDALYIIQANGPLLKNPHPVLSGFWWGIDGWLSPKLIAIASHGDGGPSSDLRTLNIETGQISYLWKEAYSAYSYDPKNKILAVNAFPSDPNDPNSQYKIILISQNKQQAIGSIGEVWNDFYYRGGVRSQFVANQNGSTFTIAEDGTITKLSALYVEQVSISPDHRWLILANGSTLEVYSEVDEIFKTITKPNMSEILWRPDSAGFFFYSGHDLYYESIFNNDPVLLPLIIQSGSIDIFRGIWVP